VEDQLRLDRRRFFRQFAGDVAGAAANLVGTVGALRESSLAAAQAILDPDADPVDGPSATPGGLPTAGFRTPFRADPADPARILVLDQRELPEKIVEHPIKAAADAAWAIREMVVRGAPAIGQVAALGFALSAESAIPSKAHARRAIIRGAGFALRAARPTAVNLHAAVDRLMARFEAFGDLSEDGEGLAAAIRAEADAIVHEATTDHGRLAVFGFDALPWPAEARPLRILTHCNTGPLACGQFGTALGVVQVAHHRERAVHVLVDETRPYLQGSRLTAWELAGAGIPHTVIADVAAGHLMSRGEVDVVLVGADRIAANGDTANKIGTYPLAVLAARHQIPFYVCAPLSSVDAKTADGSGITIEERLGKEVLNFRGRATAPIGTKARNPAFDITPADLISAIVTEEGVLTSPYSPALAAAAEQRAARWGTAPAGGTGSAATGG
jgi:methylthioribose-1-phosphate isomerase